MFEKSTANCQMSTQNLEKNKNSTNSELREKVRIMSCMLTLL